jgi:hypothetical protein
MNKKLKYLIRILLGIVIFFLVYFKVGFSNIFKTILSMNNLYWIPALLVLTIAFLVAAYNIKIHTDLINKIPFKVIMKYYMISWAFGLLAPGRIGELSIAYFLKKHKLTIGQGTAVSLFDKIATIFVLGIISIFGFYIFLPKDALFYSLALLISFIVAILLISSKKIRHFIRKYILRKYEHKFKGFYKTIILAFKKKKVISLKILLSLVRWVLVSIMISFLFMGIGTIVSFWNILIITSIASIVVLIPITPGGLGTRDITIIYLYSLIGIDINIAASISLLLNMINYSLAALVFLFVKDEKS